MAKRSHGSTSKRGETIEERRARRATEHRTGMVVTRDSYWLGKKRGSGEGQHRFNRSAPLPGHITFRKANGAQGPFW